MNKKIIVFIVLSIIAGILIYGMLLFFRQDLSIDIQDTGNTLSSTSLPSLPQIFGNCHLFYPDCTRNKKEFFYGDMEFFLLTDNGPALVEYQEIYDGTSVPISHILVDIGNKEGISPIILYRLYLFHQKANDSTNLVPAGYSSFADFFTQTARELTELTQIHSLTADSQKNSTQAETDTASLFFRPDPQITLASAVVVEHTLDKYGFRKNLIDELSTSLNYFDIRGLNNIKKANTK